MEITRYLGLQFLWTEIKILGEDDQVLFVSDTQLNGFEARKLKKQLMQKNIPTTYYAFN